MATTDPRVDAYIAKAADFAQPILVELRRRVHAACPAVVETIKWRFPIFEYQGRILCSMAAFKAHCAFGFWKSEEVREGAGSSGAMGDFGRIRSLQDLPETSEFETLMAKAMVLTASPAKRVSKPKPPLEIPPALLDALANNSAARATFEGFSPSQRREYSEWIADAKTEPTRQRRLAQALEWMAEGKTRNWKYQRC